LFLNNFFKAFNQIKNWKDFQQVHQLMLLAEKIKSSVDLNIRNDISKILIELNEKMLQRAELRHVTHFTEEHTTQKQFRNSKIKICSSNLTKDCKFLVYADIEGLITIYDLTSQNISKQISVYFWFQNFHINLKEFTKGNRFIMVF